MDYEEITIEQAFELNCDYLFNLYLRKTSDEEAADQIATAAFIRLKEKWDQLDTHTAQGLRAWLYKAADFAFRDYCKAQKRRPQTVNLDAYLIEHPNFHPEEFSDDPMEEILEAEAYRKMLDKIKEILPPKQYILFERLLEYDFDVEATANAYGLNYDTTRVYWYRIRKRLEDQNEKQKF